MSCLEYVGIFILSTNPKPNDLVSHKFLTVLSTVAIFGDEAVLGMKGQPNSDIAGSLRNLFR